MGPLDSERQNQEDEESPGVGWSRREFMRFTGRSLIAMAAWGALGSLAACFRDKENRPGATSPVPGFEPIKPNREDRLVVAGGLKTHILIREGDPINKRGDRFGKNNDFLAFLPRGDSGPRADEALLWVNHEYPIPLFTPRRVLKYATNRAQAEEMRSIVGASILKLKRSSPSERNEGAAPWRFVAADSNKRIDATTPLELVGPRPIAGKRVVAGTMGNCSGGTTPWGTVLTCEENTHYYYGYYRYSRRGRKLIVPDYGYQWQKYFDGDPDHYGWVVEFNPRTGKGRKLTALGRFSHESATCVLAEDGRPVVYSGDDRIGGCIYKFIAARKGSLDEGTLYVANLKKNRWEPLVLERPELKGRFRDQTELLIRVREAAALVGGTRLARPEDIEVDPKSGAVLTALTNNRRRRDYYGSLLRIDEAGGDHGARVFAHRTFLSGGHENGFACPDNLVFDPRGNLWMTSDISEKYMHRGEYRGFGNNGLFFIPMSGPAAGEVFQAASAPRDAEFTGPCFSADGRTLFVSVQHPGIGSTKRNRLNSHWPNGGKEVPRSAVVAFSGPVLEKLTGF